MAEGDLKQEAARIAVHPQQQWRGSSDYRGPRPALVAALLGFSAAAAVAQFTSCPFTVENCGAALTFPATPRNAVTIGQAATEVLYGFGMGERIAGTVLWFNDVLPQLKERNDQVPRLDSNPPSFESVIGRWPGLVATRLEWMIGRGGVVGTREQFRDLGVPTCTSR